MKLSTVARRPIALPCWDATVTVGLVNATLLLLLSLVVVTLAGAFAGVRLEEMPGLSRRVLPFSGGMLGGIALFWILPEIAAHSGWLGASAGLVAGFAMLWLVD